jgi:protein-tyrosine phosphatase
MPEILEWQQAAPPNAIAGRAAQALAEGRLVVFPTETAYALAASALVPNAVERLAAWHDPAAPLTLAVKDSEDARDWIPHMSPLGQRLARRCWPGPVEFVWGTEAQAGLASRLAEPVRQRLCGSGTLGLRSPAHEAILRTLRVLPGPLLLKSLSADDGEATTADQVLARLNGDDTLVIDDGPCRYGRPATVVRIDGDRWQVLREGIVPAAVLERLTCCLILFVCTGNTCRSPLAEALCKKLLAERVNCPVADLPQRGFIVQSAGLSAMMGGRAAEEAVLVAEQFGADLGSHCSQPLTADRLAQADFVLAMTRSHLQALEQQFPRLGPRPRLLDAEGYDIADPIGGSQPVYQECAQQILRQLERFLTEVQLS